MRRREYLIGAVTGAGALVTGPSVVSGGNEPGDRAHRAGVEAPTFEGISKTPEPDETVAVTDPVELSVTARSAPSDPIVAVVWAEGRNVTIVETDHVESDTVTSTLSFDEVPHWIRYGYPTLVRAVTAEGNATDIRRIEGPTVRQPYEVEIVETTAPVDGGDELAVTARVENTGGIQHAGTGSQEISLVVVNQEEVVDSETIALDWRESTEVSLSYETHSVSSDVEFPIAVESADFADETTVAVTGVDNGTNGNGENGVDADVDVIRATTPDEAGGRLEVAGYVSNEGDSTASIDVDLVVGDDQDVADSTTVEVAAGDSELVELGYETHPVRQDVEFDVGLRAGDALDTVPVQVSGTDSDDNDNGNGEGPGEVTVVIEDVNDPVTAGEPLRVLANLAHDGTEAQTVTVELVVVNQGDVVDTVDTEVAPEATHMVELVHDTYAVERDVEFPIAVRTPDDEAQTTVSVHADGADGETEAGEEGGDEPDDGQDGDSDPDEGDDGDSKVDTDGDAGTETDTNGDEGETDGDGDGEAEADTDEDGVGDADTEGAGNDETGDESPPESDSEPDGETDEDPPDDDGKPEDANGEDDEDE